MEGGKEGDASSPFLQSSRNLRKSSETALFGLLLVDRNHTLTENFPFFDENNSNPNLVPSPPSLAQNPHPPTSSPLPVRSLSLMTFSTRNSYYLRISRDTVLVLYLCLSLPFPVLLPSIHQANASSPPPSSSCVGSNGRSRPGSCSMDDGLYLAEGFGGFEDEVSSSSVQSQTLKRKEERKVKGKEEVR